LEPAGIFSAFYRGLQAPPAGCGLYLKEAGAGAA